MIERINQTKGSLFEKINKIDKSLARLTKEKKGNNPNQQNLNEQVDVTTDNRNSKDHKRLLWTTVCQQTGQPRKNGKILRNI